MVVGKLTFVRFLVYVYKLRNKSIPTTKCWKLLWRKRGINFCRRRASLILLVGKFGFNEPWKAFVRSATGLPNPCLCWFYSPACSGRYTNIEILQSNTVQYIQIAKVVQTEFNDICMIPKLVRFDRFTGFWTFLHYARKLGYFQKYFHTHFCCMSDHSANEIQINRKSCGEMCIPISNMWKRVSHCTAWRVAEMGSRDRGVAKHMLFWCG